MGKQTFPTIFCKLTELGLSMNIYDINFFILCKKILFWYTESFWNDNNDFDIKVLEIVTIQNTCRTFKYVWVKELDITKNWHLNVLF